MKVDRALLPRFVSSSLLVGILLATVYWSHRFWPLCLLVCEVAIVLGLREILALYRQKNIAVFELYTITGGVALLAAIFFSSFPHNLPGDLVLWVLFGWCLGLFFLQVLTAGTQGAIVTLFLSIAALFYVVFPFGFLVKIAYLEGTDGRWFVFYTFVTVYAADIAAYMVGTAFGRHKLIPSISPNKTLEGAVGGLLGACAASWVAQKLLLPEVSGALMMGLGFLIGIVSQIGDLWESLLKRDAQVKDSGRSIPGMGGVLDLMDGLLFCAPLVYLYIKLVLKI